MRIVAMQEIANLLIRSDCRLNNCKSSRLVLRIQAWLSNRNK